MFQQITIRRAATILGAVALASGLTSAPATSSAAVIDTQRNDWKGYKSVWTDDGRPFGGKAEYGGFAGNKCLKAFDEDSDGRRVVAQLKFKRNGRWHKKPWVVESRGDGWWGGPCYSIRAGRRAKFRVCLKNGYHGKRYACDSRRART